MLSSLLLLATVVRSPRLSVKDFVSRYGKVDIGMTMKQVKSLLGPPDDKWTFVDPEPFFTWSNGETWCWGSNGHLSLPTEGKVEFDANGKVMDLRSPYSSYLRNSGVVWDDRELLRTVIPPSVKDVSQCRGKIKWDPKRQSYVLSDGSMPFPDARNLPEKT